MNDPRAQVECLECYQFFDALQSCHLCCLPMCSGCIGTHDCGALADREWDEEDEI